MNNGFNRIVLDALISVIYDCAEEHKLTVKETISNMAFVLNHDRFNVIIGIIGDNLSVESVAMNIQINSRINNITYCFESALNSVCGCLLNETEQQDNNLFLNID